MINQLSKLIDESINQLSSFQQLQRKYWTASKCDLDFHDPLTTISGDFGDPLTFSQANRQHSGRSIEDESLFFKTP